MTTAASRAAADPAASPAGAAGTGLRRARLTRSAAVVVLLATLVQLLVGALGDAPQFTGKGFGARLVAYPVLMLLVPAVAAVRRARRGGTAALPWAGSALVMVPFLIDVTGNTLDLYDAVAWWDDVNHLVNWFLLCTGVGVLLLPVRVRPLAALGWLVAGIGALLAVGWELGEWYAFIRHGTELATAYTDTLGDLALGCLGAGAAGALVVHLSRAEPAGRAGQAGRAGRAGQPGRTEVAR